MASTLVTDADLFRLNYEEGIGVGRNVLITVNKVFFEGIDIYTHTNFVPISNRAKKKDGFDKTQIDKLDSRLPMNRMDISMLGVIIKAYGKNNVHGILTDPLLEDYLKELRETRNEYAHESHTWNLDTPELMIKLDALKILYEKILERLKFYCYGVPTPEHIRLIDEKIRQMQDKLDSLKDTLFDHLQNRSNTHYDSLTIHHNRPYLVYNCPR